MEGRRLWGLWLMEGLGLVALCAAGDWLGEGLERPLSGLASLSAMLTVVGLNALRGPVAHRRYAAVGVAAACLGFAFGQAAAQHAFNQCVDRGEDVRAALREFKARTGHYPDSLQQLGQRLPGERLLRSNILQYERRGDAYTLSFSDWLVSHSVTQDGVWRVGSSVGRRTPGGS